jgi:hypothetical protein
MAERQIQRAKRWWFAHRDKAPDALQADLDRALALLAERPYLGVRLRNTRRRGVRRLHMERVSHDIYYQVIGDIVNVVTLWHSHRRPPRL